MHLISWIYHRGSEQQGLDVAGVKWVSNQEPEAYMYLYILRIYSLSCSYYDDIL
jgi:hypothetical protein